MSEDTALLQQVRTLPARERAAALAHWIYIKAGHAQNKWSMRVPDKWETLAPQAREFNLISIDTWAQSPEILKAWIEALEQHRKYMDSQGSASRSKSR